MLLRKILIVLFALIICLSVFSLIAAQPAQPVPLPTDTGAAQFQNRAAIELLTNGGFEVDTTGDKLPDGWSAKKTNIAKSDKLKCNKVEKIVAYTGSCAFQFVGNPSGHSSKLTQNFSEGTILNHSTLTLSAFVDPKSGVADSKIASLKIELSDGSKIKLDLRLPTAEGYHQVIDTAQINVPADVFVTSIKLDLRYGETSGKYLIDDVSLTLVIIDLTSTSLTSTVIPTTATVTPPAVVTTTLSPTPTSILPTETSTPENTRVSIVVNTRC
jgi:hypothetical protein